VRKREASHAEQVLWKQWRNAHGGAARRRIERELEKVRGLEARATGKPGGGKAARNAPAANTSLVRMTSKHGKHQPVQASGRLSGQQGASHANA